MDGILKLSPQGAQGGETVTHTPTPPSPQESGGKSEPQEEGGRRKAGPVSKGMQQNQTQGWVIAAGRASDVGRAVGIRCPVEDADLLLAMGND